jgi:hypothetical protein
MWQGVGHGANAYAVAVKACVWHGFATFNFRRFPILTCSHTTELFTSLMRWRPGTKSKCRSRLNNGREYWRQRAAIHKSLTGIGVADSRAEAPLADPG